MKKLLLLTGAGLGFLAGCATPQPDAALLSAQQQVGMAANNADVVNYAQPQLRTAQTELGNADAALKDGDMARVDHHALLATRYAETAQQVAQEKRAEQAVAAAPLARDQALLQN